MGETNKIEINFSGLMSQLLSLLNPKEKDVIERRFSLFGKKKETLDGIGKSYSVTRERVRQIEAIALKKLTRISKDPSMQKIHNLTMDILSQNGNVMLEDTLVSQVIKNIKSLKDIDANSIKLAVRVSENMIKQDKNQFFRAFWRTSDISMGEVRETIKSLEKTMKQNKDVLTVEELHKALKIEHPPQMIQSVLEVSWIFKSTDDGWGLTSWRHINPRSIKDKIMVVFKNVGKSLHFREIVNHVIADFGNKKIVTPQAIHNELIRHSDFVLVGRGVYALKNWGIPSGTVCDLIVQTLQENDGPMKRRDIIANVLKKREIRMGTISLNLQKYTFFRRVGRAVYEYVEAEDTRRRNLKQKRLNMGKTK